MSISMAAYVVRTADQDSEVCRLTDVYVDVRGYKLSRQVAGVGSPVVVIDSGFGNGLEV
jgi:hypothetical protein